MEAILTSRSCLVSMVKSFQSRSSASLAGSVVPPSFAVHVRILLAEWMAVLALCAGTLFLGCGDHSIPWSNPTPDIFQHCDGFHVAGIQTRSNPAQVVNLESFWDRPNEVLIDHAMGLPKGFSNPNSGISTSAHVRSPQPTSRIGLRGDVPKNSFYYTDGSHCDSFQSHRLGPHQRFRAVVARSYFTFKSAELTPEKEVI